MNYLFFDTETNGLPKKWGAKPDEQDVWPRMLQIAWAIYKEDGTLLSERCFLVKPNDYKLEQEALEVNGLTIERLQREGIHLEDILVLFNKAMALSDTLVAHNISFDIAVVACEYYRNLDNQVAEIMLEIPQICTMQSTTEFCAIPSARGYKWPKLQELHKKLFGEEFENAHDALVDVRAMAKCFFELKRKNVI